MGCIQTETVDWKQQKKKKKQSSLLESTVNVTLEEVLALNPVILQKTTGLSPADVETLRSASCSGPAPTPGNPAP